MSLWFSDVLYLDFSNIQAALVRRLSNHSFRGGFYIAKTKLISGYVRDCDYEDVLICILVNRRPPDLSQLEPS